MVIFHARPSREYPVFCSEIQLKYSDSFQFHEPFDMVNPLEYRNRKGILNYLPSQLIPRNVYFSLPNSVLTKGIEIDPHLNGLSPIGTFQTPHNIKILYGIFSSNRLKLEKSDFLFTIIDNPIDMIYSAFYYCKYITSPQSSSLLKLLCKDYFQISIEKFIDLLLDDKFNREFYYKDVKYRIIEECFYIGDLSKYHYVIFRDNLRKGLDMLSFITGIQFQCKSIQSNIIGKCSYRRNDLEKFFEKEITQYNEIRKKFLKE